jgi:hypothetical protein
MKTQRQKIIQLLQDAGERGVSSYEFTFTHGIKQCPTRIYELKKLGFNIVSKPFRNSVIYILSHKTQEVSIEKPKQQWEIEAEQAARMVRVEHPDGLITYEDPARMKPEQLSI